MDFVAIVDADPAAAHELAAALRRDGFEAWAFRDPRMALTHMRRARPALLITAWDLPFMQGMELVERVRARFADVPAIVRSDRVADVTRIPDIRFVKGSFAEPHVVAEARAVLERRARAT